MPAGGRKSSFGRTQSQRHVPYMMDETGRGRHGTNVPRVEANSDGFEPFEELMNREPSLPRAVRERRRSSVSGKARKSRARGEDEDREESMELDDDQYMSRVRSARQQPDSARSARTISRRTNDVDFDALPSPPPQHSRRTSAASSSALPSTYTLGTDANMDSIFSDDDPISANFDMDATPSSKGKRRTSYVQMDQEDEDEQRTPSPVSTSKKGKGKRAAEESDEEDIGPSVHMSGAQRGKGKGNVPVKFAPQEVYDNSIEDIGMGGMDEDEVQRSEEEREPTPESPPKKRGRPKKADRVDVEDELAGGMDEDGRSDEERARTPDNSLKKRSRFEKNADDDVDMEDDIARGMDEIDENRRSDAESDPDNQPKKRAFAKDKNKEKGPAVLRPALDLEQSPQYDGGVRRGTRHRYAPLEWWRNEKVVYGRRENGIAYCPIVKDIIRVPKEEPQKLGVHGKRAKKRAAASTRKAASAEQDFDNDPERGWDEDTPVMGNVLDYVSKEEVNRRIAFRGGLVEYREAQDGNFYFQKVFGDAEYMAAGQLLIPVKGQKPTKTTKDNTYVFYVIEGAVTFKVHETSYILCTGGSILVPRGNTYFIENICDREARIFFAQARRVDVEDNVLPEVKQESARMRPASTPIEDRASSAGTPVPVPKSKGKKASAKKR